MINIILDSTLKRVMNYENAKEVWDDLKEIHERKAKEDCSSREPTCNIVSNENNDVWKDEYAMLDGVTDST